MANWLRHWHLLGTLWIVSVVVFFFFNTAHGASLIDNESLDNRIATRFIGDLDQIRERRILRVLISQSRTNFFYTPNGTRGFEHDLIKEYEDFLNRGPRRERYKTHVVFIPLPFEQLLDHLIAGHGDMVASGLTITPERENLVDFTHPYITNIDEILVTHKNNPAPPQSIKDLSGKQVLVVAHSSYVVQLQRASQSLAMNGMDPIEIVQADSTLESEDILELVNAELFDYTVVDSHIAKIHLNNLPNIQLMENFVFHHGGKIAWAINKNLPKLKSSLDTFINSYARQGRHLGNSVYRKYFENPYWIKHPLNISLLSDTPCLAYYFEKYATFYDFDTFLIQAQSYQESRFRQNLVSSANARGVMQIKPSTARSKIVGIPNIYKLEDNVHAGVKYLSYLYEHYFDKPEYSEEDKMNFALAAYNAGPGRIRQLQRIAKRKGLNPNKWFYNVEQVARAEIGHETVNYVTEILKRSHAFKMAHELKIEKQLLRAQKLAEAEVKKKMEALKALEEQESKGTEKAPAAKKLFTIEKESPTQQLQPMNQTIIPLTDGKL